VLFPIRAMSGNDLRELKELRCYNATQARGPALAGAIIY
jgi:hypothetical protein